MLETQYSRNRKEAQSKLAKYCGHPQKWNRYSYALNNPLFYVDPDGQEIIVTGGTNEERQAVLDAIARLRAQSTLADAAFARFDGVGTDVADLRITIKDDATFEAELTDQTTRGTAQGETGSGGIIENSDPQTRTSTFVVDVNISIRQSAVRARNDREDQNNRRESRTEGILSHEIGHGVDLHDRPRQFQANSTRDRSVPYRERENERSANLTSHRIVWQRILGRHIRHLQAGLHWVQ